MDTNVYKQLLKGHIEKWNKDIVNTIQELGGPDKLKRETFIAKIEDYDIDTNNNKTIMEMNNEFLNSIYKD